MKSEARLVKEYHCMIARKQELYADLDKAELLEKKEDIKTIVKDIDSLHEALNKVICTLREINSDFIKNKK